MADHCSDTVTGLSRGHTKESLSFRDDLFPPPLKSSVLSELHANLGRIVVRRSSLSGVEYHTE